MEPNVNGVGATQILGIYVRVEVASEGALAGQSAASAALASLDNAARPAGVGNAAATLYRVAQVDAGSGSGQSTAAVSISIGAEGGSVFELSATADGQSNADATVLYIIEIATSGDLAGVSSASVLGVLVLTGVPLQAQGNGAGAATVTAFRSAQRAVGADSAATATVSLGPLAGGGVFDAAAAGVAAVSLDLEVAADLIPLGATANGAASVQVQLAVSRPVGVGAQADGAGTATASITVRPAVAATASSAGTAAAIVAVIRSVSATPDGLSVVTANVATAANLLLGSIQIAAQATVAVSITPKLARSATAAGAATADVTTEVRAARVVSAAGAANVALDVAIVRAMEAAAAGLAVTQLTLVVPSDDEVSGKYAREHAQAYADVAAAGT